MIFCTPFNSKAPFDYADYAAILLKRGPQTDHHHLILSSKDDEDQAFRLGSELSDLFGKSFFLALPEAPRNGISLANDLFVAAVRFTQNFKTGSKEVPDPPLLYMDPGYRPTKPRWLDDLQAEYYVRQAKTVFGSGKKDTEGAVVFTGPLVISKTFGTKSALLDYLQPTKHWREALKWELNKDYHITPSIGMTNDKVHILQPRKIVPAK